MTADQLRQMKERHARATPGPWFIYPVGACRHGGIGPDGGPKSPTVIEDPEMGESNAEFLAGSWADLQACFKKIDELEKELKAHKASDDSAKYDTARAALELVQMTVEGLPKRQQDVFADAMEMVSVALDEIGDGEEDE